MRDGVVMQVANDRLEKSEKERIAAGTGRREFKIALRIRSDQRHIGGINGIDAEKYQNRENKGARAPFGRLPKLHRPNRRSEIGIALRTEVIPASQPRDSAVLLAGALEYTSQASAPGSEPSASANPKQIEKTSACSGAIP